jgi:hypothetical protein
MYRILYVMVEGDDDLRFFDRILLPRLSLMKSQIKIWKYREQKKEKINQFLRTVKGVSEWDYLFVADIDSKPCITLKKRQLVDTYTEVEESKIIVVVREIEGWYVAGLTDKACKDIKFAPLQHTNLLTKENFEEITPRKMTPYEFKLFTLDNYSLNEALDKNHSLKYFANKYLTNP